MKELEQAVERRQRARRRRHNRRPFWRALGMLGSVGWTVVVPALLGLYLGDWLDGHTTAAFSWKLSGLVGGLGLGCLSAWQRLHQQWLEVDDGN